VARAKRTDRAEARRRYRASVGEPLTESELAEDDAAATERGSVPPRAGTTAAGGAVPTRPARPSLGAAFRSSFRPIDLRGDIRALPKILTHWSFTLPVVLSGVAVALIPLLGVNSLTLAFYQYFSGAAPLGTSFVAGFFAPRASYLVGALTALASFGFQALAFSVGPFAGLLDSVPDLASPGQFLAPDAARQLLLSQALITGVPSGALFAAAAAWYKRFLNRANPNRSRPPAGSGRRPDGRQAKRNQQRPILARRR
jgi:hypothetical protein